MSYRENLWLCEERRIDGAVRNAKRAVGGVEIEASLFHHDMTVGCVLRASSGKQLTMRIEAENFDGEMLAGIARKVAQ